MSDGETITPGKAVGTALRDTIRNREPGQKIGQSFLEQLQDAASEIGLPQVDASIREKIGFAFLNRDSPIEERRTAMRDAISTARDTILVTMLPKTGLPKRWIDGVHIATEARHITEGLVSNIVEAAAVYPKKTGKNDLTDEIFKLMSPNKKTLNERAVSALVAFEIVQPYLIDRLLAMDIYDAELLQEQMQTLRRDINLLRQFYHSTSHAAELAVEGQTSIPMDELIEQMFQIGPIFVKLAQGFDLPKLLAKKFPGDAKAKAEAVSEISRGLQEGVMLPTEEQQRDIAADLPGGLQFTGLLNSASIAHVVSAQTQDGEERAVKVKRENIVNSVQDNQDTLQLAADIYSRFIEEHISGTAMGNKRQDTGKVVPFLLQVYVADLKRELNFALEAANQERAEQIYERHPGIHIAQVDRERSDDDHIVMGVLEGIRLEKLPANVTHLKNLFTFLLEAWKSRYLHGDMHGGNIKGWHDGSIRVYDYGKKVDLTPDFVKNMGGFLYAIARRNPDAIAKAYLRIQSPDYTQITFEEARDIAQDTLDSISESGDLNDEDEQVSRVKRWRKKIMKRISKTNAGIAMATGIRHQSIMDTDYANTMQTLVRYGAVLSAELGKPEYKDREYRRRALSQSIGGAIKEVYWYDSKSRFKIRHRKPQVTKEPEAEMI